MNNSVYDIEKPWIKTKNILYNRQEKVRKIMTKIALSFDDGRKDNYRMIQEILIPLQIPATINITTDYVLNSQCERSPCINPAMTKDEVIELSKLPLIEIAGHGKEHQNAIDNLLKGVKELREWCGVNEIGIASPNSRLTFNEIEKLKTFFVDYDIKYIRIGDRIETARFIKRCIRKINCYLHISKIYGWCYKETLLDKEDNFKLYSVPILKSNSLKEVKRLVDFAILNNKSLIIMFHSIIKKGEKFYNDNWSWDYDDFHKLCTFLADYREKEKIQMCTTLNILNREI